MKQENKKQHYVPQIYLRCFSGEDRFINTFDKQSGKVYQSSIDSICCEDNLYTIWDLANDDKGLYTTRNLSLEKDFFASTIEKQLESALQYFLNLTRWWLQTKTTNVILTEEIKRKVAQVIVAQILRMPDMQDYNNQLTQSLTSQIADILKSAPGAKTSSLLFQLQSIQIENQLNPALTQFDKTFFNKGFFNDFCAAIANNYWTLLCSPDAEFYTCDRPVNLCHHCDDVRPMFLGFAEEGAEVSYTINPCLVLVIWDKQHFSDKEKEDGICRIATRREIAHINILRYVTAKRHIFSVGNDFVFAKQMFDKTNK